MRKAFFNLKTLYSKLRIKHKLFVLITALMLTMCICCLAVFQYVFDVYDREMYARSSQALNVSSYGMDNELNDMEQLTFRLATDFSVQNTLKLVRDHSTSYDFYRVTDELNKRLIELGVPEKYVLSVHMFDTADREYRSGKRPNLTVQSRLNAMKHMTHARQGGNTWILPDEHDSALMAAREIRNYSTFNFERLGMVGVRIDLNKLAQDYARGLNRQGVHFVILNEGKLLFANDLPVELSVLLSAMKGEEEGYEIVEDARRRFFLTYARSSYTNWDYVILLPYDELFYALSNVKRIVMIVFALLFATAITLSIRYARSITRPIESLNAKMKTVQKGNFDIAAISDEEQYPMDETGQMHRNFRIMIERINDLINENYRKQLAVKESEYKALQAQINPHFLYNTLESINWHAKISGQRHISQMVESLAYLMRNSINHKEPFVTLREEKNFVRHYVTIQKVRFEERLDFHMDIPEELEACIVPKLILQPIVENSIQYGLEQMIGVCRIRVSANMVNKNLQLEVADNGPGIEPDVIQQILAGQYRTKGTGLGIRNIHDRIRLMFGEEHGIHIESEPGAGTRVIISVPVNWRDSYVQSIVG